ncbi:MAG: lipid-transfer protein [Myxococcota bacterium]|nr:lipid-transfer protein [Myxococcota bacterium]
MREVAIIGYSRTPTAAEDTRSEAELVQAVVSGALEQAGLSRKDIEFYCSGSCDYVMGRPFSFVMALDGIAPWPPVAESHVEMDGAFALYEAWVHLQMGHIQTALVYSFGKTSLCDIEAVTNAQLDPYTLAPLGVTGSELAALQAGAVGAAFQGPIWGDGAAAVVLAAGDTARRLCSRPAWIHGIAHNIEPHAPGMRDLTRSASSRRAAAAANVRTLPSVDIAELHAAYAHQIPILSAALGLPETATINPSGGALVDEIPMVSGLIRIGEAAHRLMDGSARTAVAHATSGPCMQQNLVCALASEAVGADHG